MTSLTVFVQLFLTARLLKGLNRREIQIDRDDDKGFWRRNHPFTIH